MTVGTDDINRAEDVLREAVVSVGDTAEVPQALEDAHHGDAAAIEDGRETWCPAPIDPWPVFNSRSRNDMVTAR